MALVARLHPMVVHFPIALVLVAAAAECVAFATSDWRWRAVAVMNLRTGAAFALLAAIAGWRLASAPGLEPTPLLEWHRWLGAVAVLSAASAVAATLGGDRRADRHLVVYRTTLFCAAMLVAVTAHLGGLLVWGADFLRP